MADAESDCIEMALQGVDAAHADCQRTIDTLNTERKQATARKTSFSLSEAIADRAVANIYTRALATSEARKRADDVMAWASHCFATKSNISLDEWRKAQ